MGADVRSDNHIDYGSRSNTAVPAPPIIVDGDKLAIVLMIGAAPTSPPVTPPPGFVEKLDSGYPITVGTGIGFEVKIRVFTKKASSESGSYAFTHTTASTSAYIVSASGAADEDI